MWSICATKPCILWALGVLWISLQTSKIGNLGVAALNLMFRIGINAGEIIGEGDEIGL